MVIKIGLILKSSATEANSLTQIKFLWLLIKGGNSIRCLKISIKVGRWHPCHTVFGKAMARAFLSEDWSCPTVAVGHV